ncbi:MAG: hypothetical protein WBC91_07070 [Phototrophicaceae bacterium]
MTKITHALDNLFINAETIINSLGDEFNSQEFLRLIIHDQQHAYIDLLNACYHLTIPFDQAHQKIGRRLSSISNELGYEKLKVKVNDTNIFRNSTQSTVYRKI